MGQWWFALALHPPHMIFMLHFTHFSGYTVNSWFLYCIIFCCMFGSYKSQISVGRNGHGVILPFGFTRMIDSHALHPMKSFFVV